MIIIFSIVALVALISLYDYFNTRSWQQVTSNVRNNAVFEKRNRAYGAYTIRRDYNKRLLVILIGMTGGAGLLFATTRNNKITEEIKLPDSGGIIIYVEPKDEIKPEIPEEVETRSEMKMAEAIEFREPVVTDKKDITDLKDLADDTKNSGNKKREGEEDGFDDFPPIKKKIVEPLVIEEPISTGPVIAQEPAEYIGGRQAMLAFIKNNLNYPEYAQQTGIQGRCFLKFVVSKKGDISAVTVARGVTDCPECDEEAVRVIRKMPLWKAGKTNGKPVDSYFNMPIGFVLE